MTKTTLRVDGMSCNHCVQTIEENVQQLEGVQHVDVQLDTGIVTVDGDVRTKDIVQTIEAQGFDVL